MKRSRKHPDIKNFDLLDSSGDDGGDDCGDDDATSSPPTAPHWPRPHKRQKTDFWIKMTLVPKVDVEMRRLMGKAPLRQGAGPNTYMVYYKIGSADASIGLDEWLMDKVLPQWRPLASLADIVDPFGYPAPHYVPLVPLLVDFFGNGAGIGPMCVPAAIAQAPVHKRGDWEVVTLGANDEQWGYQRPRATIQEYCYPYDTLIVLEQDAAELRARKSKADADSTPPYHEMDDDSILF